MSGRLSPPKSALATEPVWPPTGSGEPPFGSSEKPPLSLRISTETVPVLKFATARSVRVSGAG